MSISLIIPVLGQLLTLGFKVADIIEKSENISPEDKVALKEAIKTAQDGVKYWTDAPEDGPLSEDGPVPDNG